MPANDQQTALDATFPELEESDDSALMHTGAALVVDAVPGNGAPSVAEVREHAVVPVSIRGSPNRLSALGAPMIDVVPIVPLAAEHTLAIADVSYAGEMTFGVYADRATLPDLDVLRDGISSFRLELEVLAYASMPAA